METIALKPTSAPDDSPANGTAAVGWLTWGVLAFAAGLRLYYFFLTKDQPLWWDEALYMLKAKAFALGTPNTGWYTGRPVLLPLLGAATLWAGLDEVTIRLLWVVLSIASLYFIYRTGAIMWNERVGLVAVAFGSVFYVDLFYTMRLLVDVPQVFCVVLAAFLVTRALDVPTDRYSAWAVGPVLVLGTMMRFTVVLFVVVILLFLVAVRGTALLKAKEWYISAALGVLTALPFGLYFWRTRTDGNLLRPFTSQVTLPAVLSTSSTDRGTAPVEIFWQYVRYFPNYTTGLVTAVFAGGLLLAVVMIARHAGHFRQHHAAQRYFFLVTWIVGPFLFFSFLVGGWEDRYIALIFPGVFVVTAVAFDTVYLFIRRHSEALATVLVAAVVTYSGYAMVVNADRVIRGKLTSYASVRDAGLWIRDHTQPGDTILSSSVPQNTYYSERPTYDYVGTENEFAAQLQTQSPKYMVLSALERSPQWAYEWPRRNPDKVRVAQVFFEHERPTEPAVVVYAVK